MVPFADTGTVDSSRTDEAYWATLQQSRQCVRAAGPQNHVGHVKQYRFWGWGQHDHDDASAWSWWQEHI